MVDGGDSLPLSALQHWLFCPRQCALIHVERLWEENRLTAEGRVLHERADEGLSDNRSGVKVLRSVRIVSERLGLHGVADVVEMHGAVPYPVEYKRGRPKSHRADEVQLCAQALCLEEMTGYPVLEGAIFYGARRRRQVVVFEDDLRRMTEQISVEAHQTLSRGDLPSPIYDASRCEACSLNDLCRPQAPRSVSQDWLLRRLARAEVPE